MRQVVPRHLPVQERAVRRRRLRLQRRVRVLVAGVVQHHVDLQGAGAGVFWDADDLHVPEPGRACVQRARQIGHQRRRRERRARLGNGKRDPLRRVDRVRHGIQSTIRQRRRVVQRRPAWRTRETPDPRLGYVPAPAVVRLYGLQYNVYRRRLVHIGQQRQIVKRARWQRRQLRVRRQVPVARLSGAERRAPRGVGRLTAHAGWSLARRSRPGVSVGRTSPGTCVPRQRQPGVDVACAD